MMRCSYYRGAHVIEVPVLWRYSCYTGARIMEEFVLYGVARIKEQSAIGEVRLYLNQMIQACSRSRPFLFFRQ